MVNIKERIKIEKVFNYKSTILGIILICFYLTTIMGCNNGKANEPNKLLIEEIITEDGVIFDSLEWFKSYEKVLSRFEKDQVEILENKVRFKLAEEIEYVNPKLSVVKVYEFSQNKFVSGMYVTKYTEIENFTDSVEEILILFSEHFGETLLGEKDNFVQDLSETGEGSSLIWEFDDKSRIVLSIFNNEIYSNESANYIITINIIAPR